MRLQVDRNLSKRVGVRGAEVSDERIPLDLVDEVVEGQAFLVDQEGSITTCEFPEYGDGAGCSVGGCARTAIDHVCKLGK